MTSRLNTVDARGQVNDDVDQRQDQPSQSNVGDDLRGPWFTPTQAARYIPCKTVKAFYSWRKRKGLIARGNGTVAKADIDRILKRRSRRGQHRHPRSLSNLRNASPLSRKKVG